MAKKYECSTAGCKRAFRNHFALTAHLRFCKKGIRVNEKGKVKCAECGKPFHKNGVGAHRQRAHGVAGTSRWALKSRKARKSGFTTQSSAVMVMASAGVANLVIAPQPDVVKDLLAKAEGYKVQAAKCERLAKELAEALA